MEWIGIGILIAIGLYIAQLVIALVFAGVVGIFSVLFGSK